MSLGKFVVYYKKLGCKVLFVVVDIQCFVVCDQFEVLSKQVGVLVLKVNDGELFVEMKVCIEEYFVCDLCDLVIVDIVGCFQIDEGLMNQFVVFKVELQFIEMLLVVDVMIG